MGRIFLPAAFLLVALIACPAGDGAVIRAAEPPAPPADAPAASFTVATFNINWANPDLPGVVQAIRKTKADLVALQETNATSERFLRKNLAKEFPRMAFQAPKGRYAAAGFGFLSKVPLENLKWIEPKDGLFGTWFCRATFSGRSVQVVNVHLAPGKLEGDDLAAILGEIRKMEAIHDKEIRRIAESLAAEGPIVVLGDFNSLSGFAAPAFLAERGFSDSFAALVKDPDRHPTWKWRMGKTDIAFRLDYIYCRGIVPLQSRTIESEASDHRPVASRVMIAAAPPPPE